MKWAKCANYLNCICRLAVTELIHFFIAEYSDNQRANAGGGVEDEDIEVLELPFSQALEMIKTGEIRDGKTVLLLNYLQTSHLMD